MKSGVSLRRVGGGLALGLLATAAVGVTAPPYRVVDLNTERLNAGSEPRDLVSLGDRVLFSARDERFGVELWSTDATPAGTERLADFCPGPCSSFTGVYVAAPDLAFIGRWTADHRAELWATDGTRAGMRRLLSSKLGTLDESKLRVWAAEAQTAAGGGARAAGRLFFVWNDGSHGRELWSSDGTPEGTRQVIDLRPGRFGSEPSELVRFQGRTWFTAEDGYHGRSLYSTDGTAAGTRRVFDPATGGRRGAKLTALTVLDRRLAFAVERGGQKALWGTDGTSAGTREVLPFVSSYGLRVLHGRLLVAVETEGEGLGLWSSDGTREATVRLRSFDSLVYYLGLYYAAEQGDSLYFTARGSVDDGFEPWRTDGTAGGTERLADLCPGPCSSNPQFTLAHRGRVYFATDIPRRGPEIWSTDGTEAGTSPVADLCDGVCSHRVEVLATVGPAVIFGSFWGQFGYGLLYRTEGTPETTEPITSHGEEGATLPYTYFDALSIAPLGTRGDRLLFTAADGAHGMELWTTDGSPEGTRLAVDVAKDDVGGSYPRDGRALGDRLVFTANPDSNHPGLWITDGTERGTRSLFEFPGIEEQNALVDRPQVRSSAELDGRLWLSLAGGTTFVYGPEIRITDGTPEGTVVLPGARPTYGSMAAVGHRVLFSGSTPDRRMALFASDGTGEGTRELLDLPPRRAVTEWVALPAHALFTVPGPAGWELWTTDATREGTRPLLQLGRWPEQRSSRELIRFRDRAWFLAREQGRTADSLWSSDGTPAGTVREIAFSSPTFQVQHLIAAGSKLYLFGGRPFDLRLFVLDGTDLRELGDWTSGYPEVPDLSAFAPLGERLVFSPDQAQPHHLWISDGTRAGTLSLLDARGRSVLEPRNLQEYGGRLWFTAGARKDEEALWSSDGTPAGTQPVTPRIALESMMVPAGNRVYFAGRDPEAGIELWAAPVGAEP